MTLDTSLEIEIANLIKQKNKLGITKLFEHYSSLIYGLIYKILGNEDLAQHALEHTFVEVWENIEEYDQHKGRFINWVLNIARQIAFKVQPKSAFSSPKKSLPDNLEKLTPESCQIIESIYFYNLTPSQIAIQMELSEQQVKEKTKQAFKELRTVYGE